MKFMEDFDRLLASLGVEVMFTKAAMRDLESYPKGQREQILALIIERARRGPLLKPEGIAESLSGDLRGLAKIKPKHLALRIVYRPVRRNEKVVMEILAIGPRDHDEVYRTAARRLAAFRQPMDDET